MCATLRMARIEFHAVLRIPRKICKLSSYLFCSFIHHIYHIIRNECFCFLSCPTRAAIGIISVHCSPRTGIMPHMNGRLPFKWFWSHIIFFVSDRIGHIWPRDSHFFDVWTYAIDIIAGHRNISKYCQRALFEAIRPIISITHTHILLWFSSCVHSVNTFSIRTKP